MIIDSSKFTNRIGHWWGRYLFRMIIVTSKLANGIGHRNTCLLINEKHVSGLAFHFIFHRFSPFNCCLRVGDYPQNLVHCSLMKCLMWILLLLLIPSHSGLTLNEWADRAAKRRAMNSMQSTVIDVLLSSVEMCKIIRI